MKNIVFILFSFLIVFNYSCKEDENKNFKSTLYYKSDNITQINFLDGVDEVVFDVDQDTVYFVDDIVNNSLIIKNNYNNRISINLLDSSIGKSDIKSISVKKNLLSCLYQHGDVNNLLLYDLNLKSIQNITISDQFLKNVVIDGEYAFLFHSYFKYKSDNVKSTKIVKVDLSSNLVIDSTIIDVKGLFLSYFKPRRNIVVNKNLDYLLITDYSNYRVRMYDKDFKLLHTYNDTKSNWNNSFNMNYDSMYARCANMSGTSRIEFLEKQMSQGMNRIMQSGLINDSLFYVSYHNGNEETWENKTFMVDILKIGNKEVSLKSSNYYDQLMENNLPILYGMNKPTYYNNKAYFFTMMNYKEDKAYKTIPDWLKYSLSAIKDNGKIDMNLIGLKHEL